jgi:hypothetical protein
MSTVGGISSGWELEFEDVDNWESDSKEPYANFRDEPMAFMSYGQLSDERKPFYQSRRNVLAGTSGLQDRFSHEGPPMSNWSNHYHTPESWQNVRDLHSLKDGENYVINMSNKARKCAKPEFKEYLKNSDDDVVVNPIEMINLFKDKYETSQHFEEKGLPGIPSLKGDEFLEEGKEYVEKHLGDGGEYGFIAKPYNGSFGDGVKSLESMTEVYDFLEGGVERKEEEEIIDPEEYIVQPEIPHESDLRVITVGEDIINAERRNNTEDDIRTNLSQMDGVINGTDYRVYGKALKAYRGPGPGAEPRVEPVDVNFGEKVPMQKFNRRAENNSSLLGRQARHLANDVIDSFGPDEFNYNEDLDRKPFKIGMDFIETSIEDIQHLPDRYVERAKKYEEEDGTVYLSPELNGSPGSMADLIARWSGFDEQVSALHVNKLMRDLAGEETVPVQQHVNNRHSDMWKNVKDWYPDLGEDYLQRGYYNLKPKNK